MLMITLQRLWRNSVWYMRHCAEQSRHTVVDPERLVAVARILHSSLLAHLRLHHALGRPTFRLPASSSLIGSASTQVEARDMHHTAKCRSAEHLPAIFGTLDFQCAQGASMLSQHNMVSACRRKQ
jgi:hypothetical protein